MSMAVIFTGAFLEVISGMFVIITENRNDTPIIKSLSRKIFIGIGLIAFVAVMVMGD